MRKGKKEKVTKSKRRGSE